MRFTGKGTFTYNNDNNIKARLRLIWDEKTLINKPWITIQAKSKDLSLYDIIYDKQYPFFPWNIIGKTSTGLEVYGEGLALVSRNLDPNKMELTLSFPSNLLTFGSKKEDFDFVEFYFPNILFQFNEIENIGDEKQVNLILNKTYLPLKYKENDYIITLSGLYDVATKRKIIKSKALDSLTLKAKVECIGKCISYDIAEELMGIISDLISFIYGDSVNWIYALGYKENKISYYIFRDKDFCSFKSLRTLLNLNNPNSLIKYIKLVFEKYSRFSDDKKRALIALKNGLQFSSKRLVFPAPIVLLSTSLEEYIEKILAEKDVYYIDKGKKKRLSPCFADWVSANILPEISEEDKGDFNKEGLSQKFSALLQKTLKTRINNLFIYYNLSYDKKWVSEFVKKRNDAVHGNYVHEEDDYFVWSRIASLLERIIIKELGYKGEFYDWSEAPPVLKNSDSVLS